MAIIPHGNNFYTGTDADTKPSNVPAGSIFVTDTGNFWVYNGSAWVLVIGGTKTETFTNKTINLTNNTVTDTSRATGDLVKDNGTKYVRFARGSAGQILRTNAAGTDLEYASATSFKLDDWGTPDDNTDLDASTSRHGLLRKLDNNTANFLRGDGAWATPPGSGGGAGEFVSTYVYTVYNDAGTITARNNLTNAVEFTDTDLDPVIDDILASGDYPSFEVQPGDYDLSSGFAGWDAVTGMNAYFDASAVINVPEGFSSAAWKFSPTSGRIEHARLEGGLYSEQGASPTFAWNCIEIEPVGTNVAVVHNKFQHIRAEKCNALVYMHTTGQSWANTNEFINMWDQYAKYLVYFEHTGTYDAGLSGPCANYFESVGMQASSAVAGTSPQTLGGIIGVLGQYNTFNHCEVWDIAAHNGAAPSMTISADADGTLVNGGVMTHANFADNGVRTNIIDRWQGLSIKNTAKFEHNAATILTLKRPTSTLSEIGINFDALSSTSVSRTYAVIKAGMLDNTNTTEDGYLAFQTLLNGSLSTRLLINNNGNLYLGQTGTRLVNDISGISSSDKTITWGNFSGTPLIHDASQTATNKTINLTNNTVTDSSRATGDLIKDNGTKYVRFARGTAFQVLRTNSGATDLEWGGIDDSMLSANVLTTSNSKTVTTKAINISDNTVTATSRATGDLVKDNGTKYERFARGSALQLLRTNSGATDLEWGAVDDTMLSANVITTTNTKTLTNKIISGLNIIRATKTASTYTLTATDNIILADCTSNAIALSLPASSGADGRVYHIQKIDSTANAVTIDPNSSETINGAATMLLTGQYQGVIIWCNGSNWFTFPSVNEKVGKSTANGGTTGYTIAHGLGTTPTYWFLYCPTQSIAFTSTVDGTNINITFTGATTGTTNSVVINWRVIA